MSRTIIIAEAGVNHNGSLELAKKLVDVAEEAGVDFVKFQTFKAEKLVAENTQKAEYQKANDGDGGQLEMLKKLELSNQDHIDLINYCKSKKVSFLSTAFDEDSIDFLVDLGIPFFKIPSGEITNLPYLEKIASTQLRVIISTGMCDMDEVKDAVSVFNKNGYEPSEITVLHCNTEYPTPMKDVNLLAMKSIGDELNINVGYSDHTLGIEVPIAAVALGAKVIEKHFTLDRSMTGPDHKASLEPEELKSMVQAIRNIELALGSGKKKPSDSELKNKAIARKSIHFKTSLKKDHILIKDDFIMLRPGSGISPMNMYDVIGKKLKGDVKRGEMMSYNHII